MNKDLVINIAAESMDMIMTAEQFIEAFKKNPNWFCFDESELMKFTETIIGHCSECVRGELRKPDSDLDYNTADAIQKRMKEFFGIDDWSTNKRKSQ
jgi:hypothetical protein